MIAWENSTIRASYWRQPAGRLRYIYTNANTQMQIHKYKYTNTNTQMQIHKCKYTNTKLEGDINSRTNEVQIQFQIQFSHPKNTNTQIQNWKEMPIAVQMRRLSNSILSSLPPQPRQPKYKYKLNSNTNTS